MKAEREATRRHLTTKNISLEQMEEEHLTDAFLCLLAGCGTGEGERCDSARRARSANKDRQVDCQPLPQLRLVLLRDR